MHATSRTAVIAALLCAVLSGAACDDEEQKWKPGDAGVGDASGAAFLEPCTGDDQCASGTCATFGATQRCGKICDQRNACPDVEPWSCVGGWCSCTISAASDACDVDADCDGVADRPSVPEQCNGLDDDCNDVIDDVAAGVEGAKRYYRDADGDGFGDVAAEKWLCAPLDGYVADSRDCDDGRKQDNPEAEEVCGDAFDNDCDGRLEDPDVCGLTPIECPKDAQGKPIPLDDPACTSATLMDCETTAGVDPAFDVDEIVFKQDATRIKFTVRLAGMPSSGACASYKLAFGDVNQPTDALVYVYRLPKGACDAAGLPQLEAFFDGAPVSTTAEPAFLAASPGHVSWIVDKTEIFSRVPQPTYRVRACSNATASAATDPTACATDSCEALAHQ